MEKIYQLPKIEFPKLKAPKICQNKIFWPILLVIFLSFIFGFLGGLTKDYLEPFKIITPSIEEKNKEQYLPLTFQEEAVIRTVKETSPAVVSIIVTKDLPIIERFFYDPFFEEFFGRPFEFEIPNQQQKRVERREIGGGTGFIISQDGLILTNKHVVLDEKADYTVLANDARRFPARVLARHPVYDLAILKIEGNQFPIVELGDSDKLRVGQTVIAIGNVLGELENTVSLGVVSGLGRTITAVGRGVVITLEDVIQTDAAINRGNSGGPLLNLRGEVIGINTAMVIGGENIGFAIPINQAKRAIEQIKALGKIVYPFLGVRYVLITEELQNRNNLPVDYGAWILKGERGEPAIFPGSAAERAGLKEGDIILEFNQEKITPRNSLAKIIMKYNPGDKITLKVSRKGEEKFFEVVLGEKAE